MTYETYAFLGTSISDGFFDETAKGWVVRLFEKLNENKPAHYYLANLARSGDRSFDIFYRLCGEAIQRQVDNVIIEAPDNDLIRYDSPENPTNICKNLQNELWESILDRAKRNFKKVIVTSAFPTREVSMPFTYDDVKIWYKNEDIVNYNAMVKSMCDKGNILFMDLYSDLNNDAYLTTLDDSVHPNTEGHIMIAELAYKKFKKIGF